MVIVYGFIGHVLLNSLWYVCGCIWHVIVNNMEHRCIRKLFSGLILQTLIYKQNYCILTIKTGSLCYESGETNHIRKSNFNFSI